MYTSGRTTTSLVGSVSGKPVRNRTQTSWAIACAALVLGLVLPLTPAASAQGYEGADPEAGVFDAPANLGGGGTVEFTATGLEPNAIVLIVLLGPDGSQVVDTSNDLSVQVQADATGRVTTSVQVPSGLPDGNYTLNVSSTKADGTAFSSAYNFSAGDATPDDGAGGDGGEDAGGGNDTAPGLAVTGSSSRSLGGAAALLIVLGAGFMMVGRTTKD